MVQVLCQSAVLSTTHNTLDVNHSSSYIHDNNTCRTHEHTAGGRHEVTSDKLSNSLLSKTLPFEVSVHDVYHEHVQQGL